MLNINQILPKKKNKYGAIKTTIDGIKFHSAKEARRYSELKLMLRAKMITDLELQVPYKLHVNGQLICTYKADFRYKENGVVIVEDVKGMVTQLYKLKKKLMKAIHDVDILET